MSTCVSRPAKHQSHILNTQDSSPPVGRSLDVRNGNQCRCKVVETDKVSSRVQPEGRHEEGQCRGYEKVSSRADSVWLALETDRSCCRWIAGKISEILGNEDDVVIELCFNLLEGARFVGASKRSP